MSMSLERRYLNIMLVEEMVARGIEGESSIAPITGWSSKQGIMEDNHGGHEVDTTYYVCHEATVQGLARHEDDEEVLLWKWTRASRTKKIIEQIEHDDVEYSHFVNESDGTRFYKETRFLSTRVRNVLANTMMVNDSHHSSWEYSQIKVRQGQMFHDKMHLLHAVSRWALA